MSGRAYPWWIEPVAWLGAIAIRLLGRTWRVDERNHALYDRAARDGERFVYAFWHAQLLPLVYSHRNEGIVVLVSQHRDGHLMARTIVRLGFRTARGSSTRGGEAGVRELLAAGRLQQQIAITPDGPHGPAEEVKEGLVFLAEHLGRRIVPIGTSAASAWVLRSWDRFRVPRPLARVCISHGEPIEPRRPGEEGAVALARIQAALASVSAEVRVRSGGGT